LHSRFLFLIYQGQVSSEVRFLAHGSGYDLFLSDTGAVLTLTSPAFQEDSATQQPATIRLLESRSIPPGVPTLPAAQCPSTFRRHRELFKSLTVARLLQSLIPLAQLWSTPLFSEEAARTALAGSQWMLPAMPTIVAD